MKRFLSFILMAFLILPGFLLGCGNAQFDIHSIKSYKEIPGITQEEIDSIEQIKSKTDFFVYGQLLETEAFVLPDGSYAGFTTKLCALLSGLFGIEFRQKINTWENLISDLEENEINFTGDLTYTAERIQNGYFMTPAIAERSFRLFTLADSEEIRLESQLNEMTLGFIKGSVDAELLRQFYPKLIFDSVDVASFDDVEGLLLSGAIDAFVTEGVIDPIFDDYKSVRSKVFFPLIYTPVSLSTKEPSLEPFITVISKYLAAGGIDKLFELYQEGDYEYAKYKLHKSFTESELGYLTRLKSERVEIALEHDNYPVSFYNEKDKEFQGIALDVLTEIEGLLGIKFDVVSTKDMTWSVILDKLIDGKIAMVEQLLKTAEREESGRFIWSGTPYASSYYALLSKSDYPVLANYQVLRAKVAVIDKSGHENMYNKWFPDNKNTIKYDTQFQALKALENGDVDLLMGSEYMLLTQTNYLEKPGYKANISFSEPMDSFFGFSSNQTELCSIINKAQSYVKTYEIEKAWTSKVFDYSKKLSNQLNTYLIIFIGVLIAAAGFAIYLFIKNKKLNINLEEIVKKRTLELEKQTTTLSTMFSSIPDLVFCKDINNRYTSCNPSFESFAGLSESQLLGKKDADIFKKDTALIEKSIDTDNKVLSSQTLVTSEENITFPDGSQRLHETIKAPLKQNGEVIGIMGISRDITRRKAAEEAAKVASKAKSAFLASMSHEIRTPLNAIIGMAGIAKNSVADKEKTLKSIDQILTSSQHLLGILNDVLDMSKIESGKLELTHEPFNLPKAMQEVSGIIGQRCLEKTIKFTTNINELKDINVFGDKLRLNQVLINLLGNAVKFTAKNGEVKLSVVIINEDSDHIRLKFTVSDNGIGMSEQQIQKLFVPFEQADGTIAARFGGTGLGLSISQNLINMMGESIKVESALNAGSVFYFELSFVKCNSVKEKRQQTGDGKDLKGKRILLAEDIEVNRIIINELLEPAGIEIVEAQNGQAAVDIFKNSAQGYFDLIFMDIQMPLLNGYEATKAIRSLDHADSTTIPIIAMTANAYKEDVDQALAAGMNAHLSKPIDIDAMMNLLQDFLCKQ